MYSAWKISSECKMLDGMPEWKRELGRPRLEWDNNIKKNDYTVPRCDTVN
jgi:hypothetical protein